MIANRVYRRKLPASTLTEVLVALVIITLVSVTAIGIHTRLTWNGTSISKVKASREMQRLADSAGAGDPTAEVVIDSIRYEISSEPYPAASGLVRIRIKAFMAGNMVGELNRVTHEN